MKRQDTTPLNIGSRLEPLVDRYLIGTLTGTRHQLHYPQNAGVAVRFDSPWDGLSRVLMTDGSDVGALAGRAV